MVLAGVLRGSAHTLAAPGLMCPRSRRAATAGLVDGVASWAQWPGLRRPSGGPTHARLVSLPAALPAPPPAVNTPSRSCSSSGLVKLISFWEKPLEAVGLHKVS